MRFNTALFFLSAAALLPTVLASKHKSNSFLNKRDNATPPNEQLDNDIGDFTTDVSQLEGFMVDALNAVVTLSTLANLAGLIPSTNETSFKTRDIGDLQAPDADALKQAILSALSTVVSSNSQIVSSMDVVITDLGIYFDDLEAAGFNLTDLVNANDPNSFSPPA